MAKDVEILYLAWNRLNYTGTSWHHLVSSTDWRLVEKLTVYDDGSSDGTLEFLRDKTSGLGDLVEVELRETDIRSPVGVMNHFLAERRAPLFAKIDNDIVVPPRWLEAMLIAMDRHPEIELLGMEAGQTRLPEVRQMDVDYGVCECGHIGGVGLMRYSAFASRPKLPERGRFGFTEWQWRHKPSTAWIEPDLLVPQLDRVPIEPYVSWGQEYIEAGWQREWPLMLRPWADPYWIWALKESDSEEEERVVAS